MISTSQFFHDQHGRLPTLWELAFIEHSANYLSKIFERKHPPIRVLFEPEEMLCYKVVFKHTARHLVCVKASENILIVSKRVLKLKDA